MGGKTTLKLEDVPSMQELKPPQLFQLRRILARTSASEITDDMLLGIGRAVEVNLGPVSQVRLDIITRLNVLLTERRSFQYGVAKKK